ncbi:hypothetical protein POX_c03822 [Penicillium oxalicum]|uniref:hypothetical protein n=1 Tax=Penicillium oxalicum TaxID=69781 RepID=UPI0020B7E8FB|nr:hypothetical protein POX_c03822 [Penicillium oxalicum]KAI2790969.1 hypothetical protein POX_c03822 [Penicillium oxalicum]
MPLFHDPDRWGHRHWSGDQSELEQPAPESPQPRSAQASEFRSPVTESRETVAEVPPTESCLSQVRSYDRQDLIHRIKEASHWRSQRQEQHLSVGEATAQEDLLPNHTSWVGRRVMEQASINEIQDRQREMLSSPAEIERPRSALHSGDFREGSPRPEDHSPRPRFAESSSSSPFPHLGSSPTTPWFEAPAFQTTISPSGLYPGRDDLTLATGSRSRAPSFGPFSSSYVLKAPTSPLVHQANNSDLDFSPRVVPGPESLEPSERANRRRTLPPETFRHLQSTPPGSRSADVGIKVSHGQQEGLSFSYNSSRRSMNAAYSLQLASTTVKPVFRARRPSLASETSPKPHARWWGLFYSYPTSGPGRSIADDSPSPYVGMIDLENSLPKDDTNSTRRRRRHLSPAKVVASEMDLDATNTTHMSDVDSRRRREKKSRRAESPKCPPGGSYRIPQQGQLQIIIKNPHKTAVKLFLVPYDLSDMEPGTKTFIRQRSYSAGPIIDMPLSARKNYGTDRPEASLNATEDPHDRPVLRYLIHLNICCPSRGRFYLHSSIRVVFANRVPDGKEKLRNEIQLPEPRYSPYKLVRENTFASTASARLATESASQRQSAGQGTLTGFLPHISSPGDNALLWSTVEPRREPNGPSSINPESEELYRKLNKGDFGYGGHLYTPGRSGLDNGESLLAMRLRGLDVHKTEIRDGN